MRRVVVVLVLAACGDGGGADHDAASGIDGRPADAMPDALVPDARPDAGVEPVTFDVDDDGVTDVVVGNTRYSGVDAPRGRVTVHSGATGVELAEMLAPSGIHPMGRGLVITPDLDGDTVPDIVAGDTYDGGSGSPGGIYLYSGATFAQITHRFAPELSGSGWGGEIAALGDTDGDGRGDLAVAYASPASTEVLSGADRSRRFIVDGQRPAATGDFDGDGIPDLAVVTGADVHVLAGDDGAVLLDVPGERATGLGDLDGDGRADVGVAAGSTVTLYAYRAASTDGAELRHFDVAGTIRAISPFGPAPRDVLIGFDDGYAIHASATGALLHARAIDETALVVAGTRDLDADGVPDVLVGSTTAQTDDPDSGEIATKSWTAAISTASGEILWEHRPAWWSPFGSELGAAVASE
jgi:hypothetical protein